MEDYLKFKKASGIQYELYEEMFITRNDIAKGTPELKAYELFSKRVGCKEVYRFITIVTQNIKKGNRMLSDSLLSLAYTVWQQREQRAKIKSEKASTRMVFPLGLLLIGIILIVLTPAILQLQL